MCQNEDHSFIQKVKSGDEVAFRLLFDLHYRNLVIVAYQVLKDEELSKDAAQEVFVALWKNKSSLPDNLALAAYLKKGAINRALNILKSRRHHMGSGSEPLIHLKEKDYGPSELLQENELKQIVNRAVDAMPERCRLVYTLCRKEGLSHKEISQQLGISTKTIENQMRKALNILRVAIHTYQGKLIGLLSINLTSEWGKVAFQLFHL